MTELLALRIELHSQLAFPLLKAAGIANFLAFEIFVIYAAGTLSLAMLERLVPPRNLGQTLPVEAEVPAKLVVEDLMARPPLNWRALGSPEAMAEGGRWLASGRSPLLRVPSASVPREANYLVNPAHPDASRITIGPPEMLEWDARLFGTM
jgi:RES domain-containing protein